MFVLKVSHILAIFHVIIMKTWQMNTQHSSQRKNTGPSLFPCSSSIGSFAPPTNHVEPPNARGPITLASPPPLLSPASTSASRSPLPGRPPRLRRRLAGRAVTSAWCREFLSLSGSACSAAESLAARGWSGTHSVHVRRQLYHVRCPGSGLSRRRTLRPPRVRSGETSSGSMTQLRTGDMMLSRVFISIS